MARESSLWKWLKAANKKLTKLDMNRIENSVGSGMPDVEGCLTALQFWIELKMAKRPKTPWGRIIVNFRPKQIPWLERRWEAGGASYVLLQIGDGHKARRYLIPGHEVWWLTMNLKEKEIASLSKCDPLDPAWKIIKRARRSDLKVSSVFQERFPKKIV